MFHAYFDQYRALSGEKGETKHSQRQLWTLGAHNTKKFKFTKTSATDIPVYCNRVQKECAEILERLEAQQTCLVCKESYIGRENLATWRCRTHPGRFTLHRVWDCCQGKEYSRGCCRADHTSLPARLSKDDIHLEAPLWILDKLPAIPMERIHIVKHDNPYLTKMIIHRIEFTKDGDVLQ